MSDDFEGLDHEKPIVRDKRRFDPLTGKPRAGTTAPAADAGSPELSDSPRSEPDVAVGQVAELEAQLAERTADLQRVQAEYANYRRRVDRDRQAVGEQALAAVLSGLLPVLDDLDRARSHGESSQGFTLLSDGLDAALTKLGLERFASAGEPFDPTVHEALTHVGSSADVDVPTCVEVYQPGYRVGQRVLRPARVSVVDPEVFRPAAAVLDAVIDAAFGGTEAAEEIVIEDE